MTPRFSRKLSILSVLLAANAIAQDFVNNDLEGASAGTSVVPPGWAAVPYGDPVCEATAIYTATPDLTDVNGPVYDNGIMGNPYSGLTFISGLYGDGYQEGIMQSVSGFIPGNMYTIFLHQTIVKQMSSDFLDTTGAWKIFLDNTLIGITEPTFSSEPPVSENKPWDLRCISFTATAAVHLIKFLPTDDDTDQTPPNGLRMGIDSVYFGGLDLPPCSQSLGTSEVHRTVRIELPSLIMPSGAVNGDRLVPLRRSGVRAMRTTVFTVGGAQVFSTNDPEINWSMEGIPAGVYFWSIEYEDDFGVSGLLKGRFVVLR